MTNKLIMLGMTGVFSMVYSQVGINTVSPQGALHIDGQKNNPAIGSPSAIQRTDDVVITSTGSIGVGTLSPITKIDARANPGNATPGNGPIGIGETILAPAGAGAGAVRYSTGSGGVLQYSNGINWNTLSSTIQKSIYIARMAPTQTLSINQDQVTFVQPFTVDTNINNNGNTFGAFTAPRDGNYAVSFAYSFTSAGPYPANSYVEAQILIFNSFTDATNVDSFISRRVSSQGAGGVSGQVGSTISFTIKLNQGQVIRPAIYQLTGGSRTLRTGTGNNDGFINLSVVEL